MMITSSAFNAAQAKNRPQAAPSHAPGMLFKGSPAKDQYTGAKVYPFSTVLNLREKGKHDLASELVRDMRGNDKSDAPEESKVGFLTLQQWSDWGKRLGLFPPKTEEAQILKADTEASATSVKDFSGALKAAEPTPTQPEEPPTPKSTTRSLTGSSQSTTRRKITFGPLLQPTIDALKRRKDRGDSTH